MREVASDSPGLHAPCTHVPSEPTAMGGEPPEEAGGKGICSNVGQTDVVESLVKAGCSCRLVNANLYSREKEEKGRATKQAQQLIQGKDQFGQVRGLVLEVRMWVCDVFGDHTTHKDNGTIHYNK